MWDATKMTSGKVDKHAGCCLQSRMWDATKMTSGKVDKHALRQLQTPCRLSSANSSWFITSATTIKKSSHISISRRFLLRLFQPKKADSESASCALCSAKDPLNQASWKRSALSPNTDSWNFGARKAVSEEAPQVEMQQVGISWAAHVAY